MVAHGHGLVAQGVHEVGLFLTLPSVEEEGALKGIASVHQYDVAALGLHLLDGGVAPRHAALQGLLERLEGLQVSMGIVGMQDGHGDWPIGPGGGHEEESQGEQGDQNESEVTLAVHVLTYLLVDVQRCG